MVMGFDSYRKLAVVIGVAEHQEPRWRLRTPVCDAEALSTVLERDHGYEVWLRRDSEATLDGLTRLFRDELAAVVDERTILLVYFAGHGTATDTVDHPRGYLIPFDAARSTESLLPMERLYNWLKDLRCHHLLLLLDCCFAGAFRWSSQREFTTVPPQLYQERYELFLRTPAWQVITSAAYDELASDVIAGMPVGEREETGEHSPFFHALERGLVGGADVAAPDGVTTATELYLYLREALEGRAVAEGHRQTPGFWTLPQHRKGEFLFHVPGSEPRLPDAPALTRETSPYRGFQSYDEEHASLLFGRERAIAALLQKVESRPVTMVVGSSGTGKSSLVRAGLVPALRKKQWHIVGPFRPGRAPLDALQTVLSGVAHPEGTPAVLILDQLDELFTVDVKPAERKEFLARLADAVAGSDFKLVCTLRSDFESSLWDAKLAPDYGQARFVLGELTQDELREVIEGPAQQKVLTFDPPELVDQLINAVVTTPGALPLLSFTLNQLYLRYLQRGTSDRILTEVDYEALGRVEGSLRRRAEEIYLSLDDATRATMRALFLRLVSVKGRVISGRPVPLTELDFADDAENERVGRVLATLIGDDTRLLVRGADDAGPFVEVAHTAVIRGWERIDQWLAERDEMSAVLLHRAVTSAADEWARAERSTGRAWRDDPRLDVARTRLAAVPHRLNRLEAEFLDRSRRARDRRTRTMIGSVVGFVAVAVSLGVVAWRQGILKDEEKKRASDNALAALGTEAAALAQQPGREVDALALAVQAASVATRNGRPIPLPVTLGLAAAVSTPAHPLLRINSPSAVQFVEFSRDGNLVLTGSVGEAQLWEVATGELRATLRNSGSDSLTSTEFSRDGRRVLTADKAGRVTLWTVVATQPVTLTHPSLVWTAHFSPDGTQVLTGAADGVARVWDARTGELTATLAGHTGPIECAVFSPHGRVIVTTGDDGTARLWSTPTTTTREATPLFVVSHAGARPALATDTSPSQHAIIATAFSPDGRYLVTADGRGRVALWDLGLRQLVRFLVGHAEKVREASFSPDGSRVLTVSDDGTAILWGVAGDQKQVLAGHDGGVFAGRFSSDGRRVVTAGYDQTARIWDVSSGTTIAILRGHQQLLTSVAFSADGATLVTGSSDRSARLWRISSDALPLILRGHQTGVEHAAFSPDGSLIATGSIDNTTRVWDATTGAEVKILPHSSAVTTVAFSRDGSRLLTTSGNTARVWDTRTWDETLRRTASGFIGSADIAPDGRRIVATVKVATPVLFDLQGVEHPLEGNTLLFPTIVHFASHGTRVLTGTTNGQLRIFDATGSLERSLDIPMATFMRSAELSSNDTQIVTGHINHAALVITGDLRTIRWTLGGHTGAVNSASFSADGGRVVTAGSDHTIRVWEVEHGSQLFAIGGIAGHVTSVTMSPDGTRILAAADDGTARIYPISAAALLPLACRLLRQQTGLRRQVADACAPYWQPATRVTSRPEPGS